MRSIEPGPTAEVAASELCVENPCYGWEAASMGKIKAKPNYRRTILRLPDLDHSKLAVLNSLTSPGSRRVYEYAIDQFIGWYCSEPRLAFNRIVAVRYRMFLEGRGLAANTINQQLAAVRRLAYEAADADLSSPRTGRWYCPSKRCQATWTSLWELAESRPEFAGAEKYRWGQPPSKTRLRHVGRTLRLRPTSIRTRRIRD